MTNQQPKHHDWRNQEFKYDIFFFQITFGLIAIIVAVLIGFALFPDDIGYRSNLYTTAVGVLVTVSVLDLLNQRRDAKNAEQHLKAKLVEDLGSSINQVARRAAEMLNARGWLSDDTLVGANLIGANLANVMLAGANLKGATLTRANLKGACLIRANLEYADFGEEIINILVDLVSNYEDIDSKKENKFDLVNILALEKSSDVGETMQLLSDLFKTALSGQQTEKSPRTTAKFDEDTILPDGTNWTLNTVLARFTDPTHPEFRISMKASEAKN